MLMCHVYPKEILLSEQTRASWIRQNDFQMLGVVTSTSNGKDDHRIFSKYLMLFIVLSTNV